MFLYITKNPKIPKSQIYTYNKYFLILCVSFTNSGDFLWLQRRVSTVKRQYTHIGVKDTPYAIGIALPFPYGMHIARPLEDKLKILTTRRPASKWDFYQIIFTGIVCIPSFCIQKVSNWHMTLTYTINVFIEFKMVCTYIVIITNIIIFRDF